MRTRKRFIALTNSPSIAPTFLVSSGFGSTIRRDFGSSSIWQFFDFRCSSTWQFSKCADGCRRAKKLPETTSRDSECPPLPTRSRSSSTAPTSTQPRRLLGFDIDYKRLLKEFQSRGTLVRAFYYTAIIEDQEYSSIRPLIDWLDYNGYTVVTKATKEFIDASGRRKVKGNMDIELAVDAMELAEHIDQMVLFSGDGDFRSLVEAVQRRGVRVTVVSTISSQPPMIADELRRQADVFTDLVELQSKLGRDPSERPAPREPRHHAPQFLQRATTMAPRGDDEDFED